MKFKTRLAVAAMLAWLACGAAATWAQAYPTRSIRLVAPFPPGGLADLMGRISADGLATQTGQQVIVDNRPGAGGNIGTDLVAKAPADGYTLVIVAAGNLVINPFLYPSLPFDPLNDLAPVFNVGEAPQLLLIPSSSPATTLKEFIALSKGVSGGINYGSAGSGSTMHLAGDHFARLTGLPMTHVPYKGAAQVITDLPGGRVQMFSVGLGVVSQQLQSGALRALAVASPKRLSALPNVPTAAEAGLPGFEMTTWFGILAPRGTPGDIIQSLNGRLQKVLDDAGTRKRLGDAGIEPIGGSAQSFAQTIRADYKRWEPIVRASGAKAD